MSDTGKPTRLNVAAIERRKARERVAPYARKLDRWQSQAVMLGALAGSGRDTAVARAALKLQVEQARVDFLAEMADIRDMPSAIDYLGSLERLLATRF